MLPHLGRNSKGRSAFTNPPFYRLPLLIRVVLPSLTIACVLTGRLIDTRIERRPHPMPMRPFPEDALAEVASAEVIEALAYGRGQATQRLRLLNRAQRGVAMQA